VKCFAPGLKDDHRAWQARPAKVAEVARVKKRVQKIVVPKKSESL
jgi:hypothetical protein